LCSVQNVFRNSVSARLSASLTPGGRRFARFAEIGSKKVAAIHDQVRALTEAEQLVHGVAENLRDLLIGSVLPQLFEIAFKGFHELQQLGRVFGFHLLREMTPPANFRRA
jgi:hypothetical protein